ncbi:DNA ligase 4 [Vitis vinifera]|uniref:DNA ligase IV n=1 Tax=Vitis vinifera TaxID=29760 RepID=A0A438JFN3_VITVI|nr:DNA ligase 4 [Vitis vinifera]
MEGNSYLDFNRGVGTGLSDDELDAVVTKLKPYFRKNEYPKKAPPSFYQVTNNSKERPDIWIDSPEKSIILSITSDIRTIRSEVFAAPYSLRFPRIDCVRYDKPWHECLDVQSFMELVHSSNGTTQRGADYGRMQDSKPKRMKSSKKGEQKTAHVVPSHFMQTDVTNVKGETLIFSNMMFCIKYQAAKLRGDIIHCSWVFDCCSQKKLLPLQPKYFLFLSEHSKKKLQEEIDKFSDSYYQDLDTSDIKQLLSNVDWSDNSKTIDYYKNKYCPKEKWSRFHDCCICFHSSIQSSNSDWELLSKLALRRMKLEVSMGGGKVGNNLSQATHLVVFSVPGFDLDFSDIMESFSPAEKHLLCNKKLHVVGYQWLEGCLVEGRRLQEQKYSLKPEGLEESNFGECKHDIDVDAPSVLDSVENQNLLSFPDKEGKQGRGKAPPESISILASPKRDEKRKRGRPAGPSTKKGKAGFSQVRRTRPRIGKPPKIYEKRIRCK